ncbi:MAG: GNAT family N-acetyltransferase [Thermoplasmata archaeon]|nr:GNAT family N-acetyltransferase [Thermoplasmata archaeon]
MPVIQVGPDRLVEVQSLVKAAIADAHAHGIYHWNDVYPSMEIFLEDIARGRLHALEEHGVILGFIVLTDAEEPAYEGFGWRERDGRPLELHRLTVHPEHHRKGIATRLMAFARRYAIDNGYTSLRFDTFSRNPRSLTLYSKLGIEQLPGKIFFPRENEEPYYCYEVLLGIRGSDPWADGDAPARSGHHDVKDR